MSSLKEFVKIWGSGRQASFNLECRNGLACIKLNFYLGPPASPHPGSPPHHSPPHYQHHRGHKGHGCQQKDRERAQAAAAAEESTLSTAETVD